MKERREQGFKLTLIISPLISLTFKKKSIADPIFNQCCTSAPPENIRKTPVLFSGCIEVEHWLKMC